MKTHKIINTLLKNTLLLLLKIKRSKYFYPIVLFLIGLLPIFWFKGNFVIRPEELSYINYSFLLEKYIYAWSTHTSNGLPSTYSNQLILFPVGLIYSFFEILHLGEQQIQKIILVLFFESALFSSYFLFSKFSKNNKLSFLSSIFYTFNFYTLSIPFYTAKMIQLALIPLIFLITTNYFKTKKIKYIFINFIVIFLCQGIFSNIANTATTISIYFLAFFYHLYTNKHEINWNHQVKAFLAYLIAIFPIMLNIGLIFYYSVLGNNLYVKLRNTNAFANTFLSTPISKIFTIFHGAWWENSKVYNPWFDYFNNPLVLLSSAILFSFLLIGFLTIKKKKMAMRKSYIFWLLIFCGFLFLVKGINHPFGSLYKFIFFNLPGFFIFREPWAKFTPLLTFSGSMLLLLTLDSMSKHKRIIYMATLLVFLNALPFFTANVIGHSGSGYSDVDILIPKYWKSIHAWSKEAENTNLNIFDTPVIYGTQEYYNWQGYEKGNLTGSFAYTYLYSNSVNKLNDPTGIHYEFLKVYSPKLLSLFNINYVLDQTDVVRVGKNINYSTEQLVEDGVIEKTPTINFGKLNLYKVQPEFFLPRIYPAENIYKYYDIDNGSFPHVLNIRKQDIKPAYIRNSGKLNLDAKLNASSIIIPNKVKSSIQNLNEWDNGWAWPIEVNTSPSSPKYKLVNMKEFFSEMFTNDSIDKANISIWHAGKRVEEIKKYNPPSQKKKSLLEDYTSKMEFISDTLKNYPASGRDERYWGTVKKFLMYSQRFLQSGVLNRTAFLERNQIIYQDFQKWTSDKINQDCKIYCYEITPNDTGKYDIYVRNSKLRKIWPNARNLSEYQSAVVTISLKEEINTPPIKIINISPTYNEDLDKPVKIATIELLSGQSYFIDLSFENEINLLKEGEWLSPDIKNQTSYSIEYSPQSPIKGYTFNDNNDMEIWTKTILEKDIENWEPNNIYKISFKYKISDGNLGVSIAETFLDITSLSEGNTEKGYIDIQNSKITKKTTFNEVLDLSCALNITDDYCWTSYEKLVSSNGLTTGASMYFYSIPSQNKFSDIKVKDIKVESVATFKPILVLENQNKNDIPNLDFTMINPTKYIVKVTNATSPYVLVFSQTFHTGWKLYLNNIAIANNHHEIVNGFANSWIVTPEDVNNLTDYTLILEYYPQKIFYITWGITFLLLILSIMYLLFESIFKKQNVISTRKADNESYPLKIKNSLIKRATSFVKYRFLKYKNILLTLMLLGILFQEVYSYNRISDFLILFLIMLSITLIKIYKLRSETLIYLSLVFIALVALFNIFGNDTYAETFATWAYVLIIFVVYKEFFEKQN